MLDVLNRKQRSFNMSRIRSKDTKPELLIRKALFAKGFRYRLHQKNLPGRPDLVFSKYKAVIFINGCFWHYHGCHLSKLPSTRRDWWKSKLEGNRSRDQNNREKLLASGWKILIVWECVLHGKNKVSASVISKIEKWLLSDTSFLELTGD